MNDHKYSKVIERNRQIRCCRCRRPTQVLEWFELARPRRNGNKERERKKKENAERMKPIESTQSFRARKRMEKRNQSWQCSAAKTDIVPRWCALCTCTVCKCMYMQNFFYSHLIWFYYYTRVIAIISFVERIVIVPRARTPIEWLHSYQLITLVNELLDFELRASRYRYWAAFKSTLIPHSMRNDDFSVAECARLAKQK